MSNALAVPSQPIQQDTGVQENVHDSFRQRRREDRRKIIVQLASEIFLTLRTYPLHTDISRFFVRLVLSGSIIASITLFFLKFLGLAGTIKRLKTRALLLLASSSMIKQLYHKHLSFCHSAEVVYLTANKFASYPDVALSLTLRPLVISKKLLQKAHATLHREKTALQTTIAPLASSNNLPWTCLRIAQGVVAEKPTFLPIENQLNTTSELSLAEAEESKDLPNIYYHFDRKKDLTITCGAINTKKKADQFIAALLHIRNLQQQNLFDGHIQHCGSLRLTLHQLNSFTLEGNFIRKEHLLAAYMEKQLTHRECPDELILCHTNRCINALTKPTLAALTGEENRARRMNLNALATQLLWLANDVPCGGDGKGDAVRHIILSSRTNEGNGKSLKELRKLIVNSEYSLCQTQWDPPSRGVKRIISRQKADIFIYQRQLQSLLIAITRSLQTYASKDAPPLHLMTAVLSNQLQITNDAFPSLSPTQEAIVQLLLDSALGAISEINCKSGLDRTGILRALHAALQQTFTTSEGAFDYIGAYNFIVDWSVQVDALDSAIEISKSRSVNPKQFDFGSWIEGADHHRQCVARFQAAVWEQLCSISLPITARSTGLCGLKWHFQKKSISAKLLDFCGLSDKNFHPLPYLPMYGFDQKSGRWFQIIKIVNNERKMTKKGISILMGLSGHRQS